MRRRNTPLNPVSEPSKSFNSKNIANSNSNLIEEKDKKEIEKQNSMKEEAKSIIKNIFDKAFVAQSDSKK